MWYSSENESWLTATPMLSRELTYTSGSPTETPAKVRVNGIWFWYRSLPFSRMETRTKSPESTPSALKESAEILVHSEPKRMSRISMVPVISPSPTTTSPRGSRTSSAGGSGPPSCSKEIRPPARRAPV